MAMAACQINELGFCIGCPSKCQKGEKCWFLRRFGSCRFAHSTPEKGWGAPHENCCFQEQEERKNSEKVLTDKLIICTFNIGLNLEPSTLKSNRSKLKAFLQKTSSDIVCLQEFQNDEDLMELLDHLKETKSKFTYCARSSHSHCAILSTLPLQEVNCNENARLPFYNFILSW